MSAIVILAKHNFTVGAGDSGSKLVAVPALLQNRCCNSKFNCGYPGHRPGTSLNALIGGDNLSARSFPVRFSHGLSHCVG